MKWIFYSTLVSIITFLNGAMAAPPEGTLDVANKEEQFLSEIVQKATENDVTSQGFNPEVSDGLNNRDIVANCDPKLFEELVLSLKPSDNDYFKLLRLYFDRCEAVLSNNSPTGPMALLKFVNYKYSFSKHPQISTITIKLENGLQVPAILALKPDSKPRPLVVVKCGTFCAAEEGPTMRVYLMTLFDQTPFNVVFLSSQTGIDYMKNNHVMSLGGWSEGQESLAIGKWLKEKWELKGRVSSVHLMGISLGGNAAVFGAAFNDLYPQQDGNRVYSSVTAICPVIALQPTLESLFTSFPVGTVFAKYTRDQFISARPFLNDVSDLLQKNQIPSKDSEIANFLGFVASTSLQRRGLASTTESFFNSNDFWNLKQNIKTPLLVWASQNDIIVNNKINAQSFAAKKYTEQSPNVGVLNLQYGSHCAFQSSYGPLAASTVLRTFVMSHSPEFTETYKENSMPWRFGFDKLNFADRHLKQTFNFKAQSDKVTVVFKIFKGSDTACRIGDKWLPESKCYPVKNFDIPISEFKDLGARIPKNNVEAESLSREFNTKVQFKTKDFSSVNGTSTSDFLLSWRAGYE